MIGREILHFKIVEKIGEGGMGVVYKAEDTKLKRMVAIKFLPREVAADNDTLQRFRIEAQAAAALNHPNIATSYALLGEKDGCARTLRRAIEGGFFSYPAMINDPFLKKLNSEPEIQELFELAKSKHEKFKEKYFAI